MRSNTNKSVSVSKKFMRFAIMVNIRRLAYPGMIWGWPSPIDNAPVYRCIDAFRMNGYFPRNRWKNRSELLSIISVTYCNLEAILHKKWHVEM